MPGELVPLEAFGSPAEARLAMGRLLEAGISAHLEGELTANTLNYLGSGLGGVKILVSSEDVERARDILDEACEPPVDVSPWKCSTCGTKVEGGFDACWSCGAERDFSKTEKPRTKKHKAKGSKARKHEAEDPGTPCPMCGAMIPPGPRQCPSCGESIGRSPASVSNLSERKGKRKELEDSEAEAIVRRAWQMSIIGLGLCPPLMHLYSAKLMIDYRRAQAREKLQGDWRATAAFWVNSAVILAALAAVLALCLR